MKVRPFGPEDVGPLCALVDADRLPGQPPCTLERVAAVLSGRSSVDAWSWGEFATMRILSATSDDDELLGAGAIGRRASGWRHLLWLHGREDPAVVNALVVNLLRGVRRADPISAFSMATELSVGLEGLPRHHRSATHDVLVTRGFRGQDRWLYLRAPEPGPAPEAEFRRRGHGRDVRVEITSGRAVVGGAEVAVPTPDLGVVWWLEVDPEHRGRGHGRQLLRASRQVLAEAGAKETILFVDHNEERRAALALYRAEGFTVVDHLWSYRRGDAPPEEERR